jgi:hypothetical protein
MCGLAKAPRFSWCHLIPQSAYVWDGRGGRTCAYVLRYEHLVAEFDALARLYGRTATTWVDDDEDGSGGDKGSGDSVKVQRRKKKRRAVSILDAPGVARKRQQSTQEQPLLYQRFDSSRVRLDLRRAVAELYEADYRLLGYDDYSTTTTTTTTQPPPPLIVPYMMTKGEKARTFRACMATRDPRVLRPPPPPAPEPQQTQRRRRGRRRQGKSSHMRH